MKDISRTLLLLLLFVSCKKEYVLSETGYIGWEHFKKEVVVNGHQYNSLIIENCSFTKKGLIIGNAGYVIIRNCIFSDIKGDGIEIGFLGEAHNIIIENCTFRNIGLNGIDSHENAGNCVIRNCSFENIGMSEIGTSMSQPHHAIYWKGKNVLIEKNEVISVHNENGDAISIRSSGIVRQNKIHNSTKAGIMYFTDHPGGDSLLIENNFIYNNPLGIVLASQDDLANHNRKIIIRFNTLIQDKESSIYVDKAFETTTSVVIYGNVVINKNGVYFETFFSINEYSNLKSTSNIGFVNMLQGDLHLISNSTAIDFCSGLLQYPVLDIDNQTRNQSNLDAGADEY